MIEYDNNKIKEIKEKDYNKNIKEKEKDINELLLRIFDDNKKNIKTLCLVESYGLDLNYISGYKNSISIYDLSLLKRFTDLYIEEINDFIIISTQENKEEAIKEKNILIEKIKKKTKQIEYTLLLISFITLSCIFYFIH